MEPFTTLAATAAPIDIANCDTDQIIPARFLRRARSDPDYPRFLLHDHRFRPDGTERPGFVLNRAPYRGAGILVAERNWGCGSSRENAVSALVAYGIRAVVAPSFGDIHHANCMKQGVLPVRLADEDCARLRAQLRATPGAAIAVDLPAQTVTGPDGARYRFAIDAFDKHRMLNGLDDIDLTLRHEADIAAFEARRRETMPWLA